MRNGLSRIVNVKQIDFKREKNLNYNLKHKINTYESILV